MSALSSRELCDLVEIGVLGVAKVKFQSDDHLTKGDLYWIYPPGFDVNDITDSEVRSMKYSKVDDAARHILTLGNGTLMAKLDIAPAYCNIPVHTNDRHLFGTSWPFLFLFPRAWLWDNDWKHLLMEHRQFSLHSKQNLLTNSGYSPALADWLEDMWFVPGLLRPLYPFSSDPCGTPVMCDLHCGNE